MILNLALAEEVGEALIDAAEIYKSTQSPQTVVLINGTTAVSLPLDAHSSTDDYKVIATILQ